MDTTTPRLTTEYAESLIVHEDYHHFHGTGVTVCCMVLEGSHVVIAEAFCANPDIFDLETGRKRARRKALDKIMDYERYYLRKRQYETALKRGELE